MAFISPDSLSLFFDQVENHTKPEIDTPNFGGYAMLDKNSHV